MKAMLEAVEAPNIEGLLGRVASRDYRIGIIGMGYVGLPLALAAIEAGFPVVGFDIDPARADLLKSGRSGIKHIASEPIAEAIVKRRFRVTSDLGGLEESDAILVAVPTPLSKQREPDLTFVENSTRAIAKSLRRGQLVVLESTTWPGTTRELMQPILQATGLKAGTDFFLAFSPEREDPGNPTLGVSSHSEGGWRRRPGFSTARMRSLCCARHQDCPGLVGSHSGGRKADREYLPVSEHRPRERTEGRLREDGDRCLGGDRGRQD